MYYEEGFKLVYDQVEWVAAQHYQEQDINEILDLWRLLNFQIIRLWKNYPAERQSAQCDNGKLGVSLHTVAWLANDYVEHMKSHLVKVYN